jgi:hypothetical protein
MDRSLTSPTVARGAGHRYRSAVRRYHGPVVGYIGKGTPDLGLGLSALALIAGYNVSGVFAFLDELCNRVFRPGQAVH